MLRYPNGLPQLAGDLFLTDGGIETTLIFHEGLELPDFAAFHLLKDPIGEAALRKYFRTYAEIAKRFNTGLILESATWRASADWGTKLSYSREALADANRKAIHLLEAIRKEYESGQAKVVISGCVGPRGDGYIPTQTMSEEEAEAFLPALIPLAAKLLPLAAKALPIASKILPKVAPQLTRGVSQVVRTLRSNPTTKPLVRAVPTIVRRTAANIAQQAAKGQPVTSRTAAQTLARQTARVLSNPRQCVHAYQRSKAMDKRYHRGALAATRR